MKKTFLFILIIIAFYSIDSIGKYSGILEYNFLSVNIIVIKLQITHLNINRNLIILTLNIINIKSL